MDCKVGEIILYTQKRSSYMKKTKKITSFFFLSYFEGAYSNEPAWGCLGLAKYLHRV
jgi:hypothetical protein